METWIPENADNVTKYDIVPHGFHVLHSHRPIAKRGGGISVISRNSIRLDAIKSPSHSSFESLTAKVSFSSHCLFLSMTPKPNGHFIQKIGGKTFDSYNYLILCSLNLAPPPPLPPRIVISRSFENFDDAVFEKDFRHIHNTLTNLSDVPVEEFLTTMNNSFQSLIDHHAHFRTHIFRPSSHSHHKLSTDAIATKRKRRKLERKISLLLRSSKPVPTSLLAALKEFRKTARALIFKSRADYFNNMLVSVKPNSKVFWKTANSILHRSPPPPRSSSEAINLVNTFSSFFKEKIALIHKSLPTSILRCPDPILPDNRTPLSYFSFVSIEEVSRLILTSLLQKFPNLPTCLCHKQYYPPPLKQQKFSLCLRKAIWILPFLRTTALFLT